MSRRKPDVFSSQLGLQTGVERLFSALSLPELIRQEPLADPYMLPLRHADPVRTLGRLLSTKSSYLILCSQIVFSEAIVFDAFQTVGDG